MIGLAVLLTTSVVVCREGVYGLRDLNRLPRVGLGEGGKSRRQPTVHSIYQAADAWVSQTALGAAAGCAGLLVFFWIGFISWRHRWLRQFYVAHQQAAERNQQLDEARFHCDELDADRTRLEQELRQTLAQIEKRVEERTAALAEARAQLEQELQTRRAAERVLAQQAKELERSKDVLELHVQARTKEVQKLQRRTESILNSAGEGIYGVDLQGMLSFVNPAAGRITGWNVEELTGQSERNVFLCYQPGETQHLAGSESLAEQVFYRKDGTTFPVEYMRAPIREGDRAVGAVVIFRDITERKCAEDALNRKAAELARSNAELEQFAYVASHDLQEPLRKIQAFGDRLKTRCDAVNLAEGRDYLERMQNAAARMQTLINDLLTFSRVISASQPFVFVDLAGVAKGVLNDLEVRIEQTRARVEVGPMATIEADPLQMRQLLQNLIGNALKFPTAANCGRI